MINGKDAINIAPSTLFDYAQVVIDGRPLRGFRIVCAKCGKSAVQRSGSVKGRLDTDGRKKEFRQAQRKFRDLGWSIGKRRQDNKCPDCINILLDLQNNVNKGSLLMSSSVINLPRQMGREDRRIVFEKLNDVYVDEKTGYSAGWTDSQVAKDLNVPMAWVVQIRDENFGPSGSNQEIDKQLKEALETANKLREESFKCIEHSGKLVRHAEVIEARLAEIEKRVRPG